MLTKERVMFRNNVKVMGSGDTTLILAHGFGCDQNMWQYLVPRLKDTYTLVLFDYVGSGDSLKSDFNEVRYSTLDGYARDVIEVCEALELTDAVFVGHSVSSNIGLLAAAQAPERITRQVMVCPSPCFLNMPPDYFGGFEKADLDALIDLMESSHTGWAEYLAPIVVGEEGTEDLVGELSESFCSTDPTVAKTFAVATFFSDYRYLLPISEHPTLILQSEDDKLASVAVGEFVHQLMPNSLLSVMPTKGHCIHMTHPDAVAEQVISWLNKAA